MKVVQQTLLTDGGVLLTGGATASKLARDTVEIHHRTNTLERPSLNTLNIPISTIELYIPSSDSFISIASSTYSGLPMTLTILSEFYNSFTKISISKY